MNLNLRTANVNYPDYVVYLYLESWSRRRIGVIAHDLNNHAQELVGSYFITEDTEQNVEIRYSFWSDDLANTFYENVKKVLDENEDLISGQVLSWVEEGPDAPRSRFRSYSPHTGRWGENIEEDYTPDIDEGMFEED